MRKKVLLVLLTIMALLALPFLSTVASGKEPRVNITVKRDNHNSIKTVKVVCQTWNDNARCKRLKSVKAVFLTEAGRSKKACASIYGGPETIKVSGTFKSVKVTRKLTRTNACEIADYKLINKIIFRGNHV